MLPSVVVEVRLPERLLREYEHTGANLVDRQEAERGGTTAGIDQSKPRKIMDVDQIIALAGYGDGDAQVAVDRAAALYQTCRNLTVGDHLRTALSHICKPDLASGTRTRVTVGKCRESA